ncbi:MAG: hypothetical protein HN341_07390 [Verrucomicrobia bacterium]|nr:hypothetical protein [Verrucomicrobiota bacterium]
MSEILFSCPHCSKRLAADDSVQGVEVPCTDCGKGVRVPPPAIAFSCPACEAPLSVAEGLGDAEFICPACHAEIPIPRASRQSGAPWEDLFQKREVSALSRVTPQVARKLMWSMAGLVILFILILYVDPLVGLFRRSPEPDPFLHQSIFSERELRPIFVEGLESDSPFDPIPFSGVVPLPTNESSVVTDVSGVAVVSEKEDAGETVVSESAPSLVSNGPVRSMNEVEPVQAVDGPSEIEIAHLDELRGIFENSLAQLEADGAAEREALGAQYLAQLEPLRDALQAEGDLNGYLAVVEEARAFAETHAFAQVEPVGASLAALREQYRRAEEKAALAGSRRIAALREQYQARLEKMKREYTQQGDIPSARRVAMDVQWLQSNAVVSSAAFVIAEAEARALESAREAEGEERDEQPAAAEPAGPQAEVLQDDEAAAIFEDCVIPRFSRDASSLLDEGVSYSRVQLSSTFRSGKGSGVQVALTLGHSQLGDRLERKRRDFVERTHEQRLVHRMQLAFRAPEAPKGLRDAVAVAQYFASDASGSSGATALREFSQELIRLPPLYSDWLYVACPPVETWGLERDVFARQYRRATRSGLRFEGVVISVFKSNGTLLYQSCSNRSLRKMGLKTLPKAYRAQTGSQM